MEEEVVEGRVGIWGKIRNWLKNEKGKWFQEMKGSLSTTASLVATMAFTVATNPPGGVLQGGPDEIIKIFANCNNTETPPSCLACNNTNPPSCLGLSVMAVQYPEQYRQFLISNALSFFPSIAVCLMLVSGINLNQRLVTFTLSSFLCLAMAGLVKIYILAVNLVTPDVDIFAGVTDKVRMALYGTLILSILIVIVRSFI